MSVIINGMEMPKSCGDCPCLSETYCCCVDGVYPYDCNILIQDTEEGTEFIGRLSNCPLVEVPIHGRLIDADAMTEKAFKMSFDNRITEYGLFVLNRAIQEMPTVIKGE